MPLRSQQDFRVPHFSWALTRVKCVIPCDRFNLDTEWALLAKRELEKGNNVIIFPEGKCRYDGLLNEFKTGFAFLARSTGAPVLSVGLEGVYKIGRRTRIVVGEPEKIERVKGIPSSKHLAERSEYFRQKVWTLKQRALGVAAKYFIIFYCDCTRFLDLRSFSNQDRRGQAL